MAENPRLLSLGMNTRLERGNIAGRIKTLFYQCTEVHGWYIEEMNVRKDHIHMLVQVTPEVSVAKVVQYFKGGSSRAIRHEYPELEEFVWGDSFWADGYFAEIVGIAQEKMVKRYIREQASTCQRAEATAFRP